MSLARIAIFGLAASLLLSVAGAFWWVQTAENNAAHEQVELASRHAALRLQDYVRARLVVLESIALEKQSGSLQTEQSFQQRVEIPRTRLGGFKAINWVAADGTIAWLNPEEGNEPARGKNVLEHSVASPYLKRAFDTQRPQRTNILNFFQGGRGFATYFPVVRDGVVIGAVNGVFDSPAAVTDCLSEGMLGSYEVGIRDGEQLVFETELFSEAKERDSATATLTILDREWTIEAAPNTPLHTSQHPGTAWFVLVGAAGIFAALLALAVDLRKRRRGELENSRLAALVEASSDAHMIVGGHGEIHYLNAAGYRLLDSAGDLLRRDFETLIHPNDRHQHSSLNDRFNEHDRWSGEVLFQNDKGDAIPVLLRAVRLHDNEDGEVRIAVAASDLREQRKLEADLRDVQKIEALGHLAGGIAHDFNNLLTALLGFARMARDVPGLPEEAASNLDEVLKAGDRGAALTRNLLLVSRRQATDALPVSIARQVDQTRQLLRAFVPENIDFSFELDYHVGAVVIDPVQLEQVLMNLTLNSVHAMPEGGSLHVRVEERDDEWIVLSVEDDGCGMSEEVQRRATEAFFSTRVCGRGTGLGLYSVAGIVDNCGGHLEIDSVVGRGTRIEVRLPRSTEAPNDAPDSERNAPKSLAGTGRILLVEDNSAVLESTRRCLESAGYEVLSATDGRAALELFERAPHRVDLLVSDVVMPRLGGRELASQAVARRPDLNVVLCSGYVERELTASELTALNAVFLSKPYELTDLLLAVRSQLGAGSQSEPQPLAHD